MKKNISISSIIIIFTIFILIISFTFTAFFIYYQHRSHTDALTKKGELLSRLLAYNAKLGVFSKSEEILNDPVLGILQVEGVLRVSVFTLDGKVLKKNEKSGVSAQKKSDMGDEQVFERLKGSESILYFKKGDTFEFWAPVISVSGFSTEESLFFKESSNQEEATIIGFVGITLDKRILNKRLDAILFKSIILGIIFLMIGSITTYLIANRITKPLNRLTKSVNAFWENGSFEKVHVESKDEIGRLALAFNHMAEFLKRREAEKQQLQEQIRHAQKMEAIGMLAGGIAHDFNNILTAIIGCGNLLQMKISRDDPLGKYVEYILASSSRAANLIQSLLAFSRKQIIKPRPVNINEIVKSIERLLGRLIDEEIELNVNFFEKDLITMIDPGQIEQILMNLAVNAKDAMPDGGVLTINTGAVELGTEFFKGHEDEKPGRYVLLSVTDTGIGIDGKTREKIFDPFFTTKAPGEGPGLGLSVVYGIIKQHDGYIDVESEPRKGTIFRIYLPLTNRKIKEHFEESNLLDTPLIPTSIN